MYNEEGDITKSSVMMWLYGTFQIVNCYYIGTQDIATEMIQNSILVSTIPLYWHIGVFNFKTNLKT